MRLFQNIVKKLNFKPLKPKEAEFSRARDLKVIRSEENRGVRKFLAASPVFMRKYKGAISVASRLILSNLRKLKNGEVVEKDGFVIKAEHTGKRHAGSNTEIALSVSFKGKTFFVKIGSDVGNSTALAYKKAKKFFEEINNSVQGYRVEIVPYHLLYLKSQMSNGKSRGFLVSDFFPSSKVTLVEDIVALQGNELFDKSRLGQAVRHIEYSLFQLGIVDAKTHNCFVDNSNKTLYFFDLWLD